MGTNIGTGRRRFLQGILPAIWFTPLLLRESRAEQAASPTPSSGSPMYLIREVFRCKPGKSRQVAEKFKKSFELMKGTPGVSNGKVMLDFITSYWTVVLEMEVENLEGFDREMATYRERADVQAVMAGYMDLVDEGHREIYRLV
jgi:hypothetical protein